MRGEVQGLLFKSKVLVGKSWKVACSELNIPPPRAMDELRAAARAMCEKFYGIKSERDGEKYLYLTLT